MFLVPSVFPDIITTFYTLRYYYYYFNSSYELPKYGKSPSCPSKITPRATLLFLKTKTKFLAKTEKNAPVSVFLFLLVIFSPTAKSFSIFPFPDQKKNMSRKKTPLKQTNKLKAQIKQVIETTKKINSDEHLLKHIPPYLLDSLNSGITTLAFSIEQIDYDRYNSYRNTILQLEKEEQRAARAYSETLNNWYLHTIEDIKKMKRVATLTYDKSRIVTT